MVGLAEWLAGNISLEYIRRKWPPSEEVSTKEVEDELWDTFGEETLTLSPPNWEESIDGLVDVEDELQGEVLNIDVDSVDGEHVTTVGLSFDEDLVKYLPENEERAENSIRFWLERDKLSASFYKNSRVGPILEIHIPSTQKSEVNIALRVVSEIVSRVVYFDTTMAHYAFEHLEAGLPIESIVEELPSEFGDLSGDEVEDATRLMFGSIAGHDPETGQNGNE